MKIEGKCKCGDARYLGYGDGEWFWMMETDGRPCVDLMPGELQHCPVCGDHLAPDGFAYEMVRKDSVAEAKKILALHNRARQLYRDAGGRFWETCLMRVLTEEASSLLIDPAAEGSDSNAL